MQGYSSKLLESAVSEFAKLPGIGRKTALRLVLHLLKQEGSDVESFGNSVIILKKEIKFCVECHNISDTDICDICSSLVRDRGTVCVVESIRDVIAIENTRLYKGVYHVLGGIISPMDGIGPKDLNISSLEAKAESGKVKEVILALSATLEGDTTNFYVFKKLSRYPVEITTLARGVSIGDELEYADEITLGRSIQNRVQFEPSLAK